jgi:hypothetical protein
MLRSATISLLQAFLFPLLYATYPELGLPLVRHFIAKTGRPTCSVQG